MQSSWGASVQAASHHLLRSTALGGEVIARI